MKLRFFERLSMFALLICMSLLCAVGARAQETGDIVGTVTDSDGSGGAKCHGDAHEYGNQRFADRADRRRRQLFVHVAAGGKLHRKSSGDGIQDCDAPAMALSSGDRARADIKLEVGEQTTTVEVQATVAPALQTDTSNVGQITSSQTVEDLPLNGRNLIQLVATSRLA